MGFKILAINPGSTSTKIALYDDEQPTLALTLRHSAEEIARFPRIIDQLDWRKEMVLEALAKNNFDVKSLSAVIGRGGLIKPIESGVYEVNAALKNDLVNAQREHASNLGGLIAEQIAQILGRLGGRFHFGFLDGWRRGGLAGFGALLGRLAQDFEFGAQSRQIRFGQAGVRWLHGRLRGFNGGRPCAPCGQGEGRDPREEEVQAPEQQQCEEQAEQEHEELFPPRLAFHHNRGRERGDDGAFRHFAFADDAIRIAGCAAGERRLRLGGDCVGENGVAPIA